MYKRQAKYGDHLPLYRQSGIYAREGVELERSTLAGWVGQCNALLRPLVAALQKHVLSGEKLHADDTPVPVLAPVSYTHLDVYMRQAKQWALADKIRNELKALGVILDDTPEGAQWRFEQG